MATNQYSTNLTAIPVPSRPRTHILRRPTFVPYADMSFNFNLFAGQPLRLRETVAFAADRVSPVKSHIWQNRPIDEAFMGSYIIVKYFDSENGYGSVSEKIIGKRAVDNADRWVFSYSYDWDLHIYPGINDRPSFGSVIYGCNAELRPAAVSNSEITPSNVLEYAKILFLLGKKQLSQAASAITQLSQPTTAGYRFPDGVIFRSDNQTQLVALQQGQISTAIGDIWITLEEDFSAPVNVEYDIRAVNFGSLLTTPAAFQFPATIQCLAPEAEAQLPVSNECYTDFQSFLFSSTNRFPSLSAAEVARFIDGRSRTATVVEREWLCPNDNADVYSYWSVEDTPEPSNCQQQFNLFLTNSGRYPSISALQTAYPGTAPTNISQGLYTCSSDTSFQRDYFFISNLPLVD